jgi:flagellar hook-basal body complex protein FliE
VIAGIDAIGAIGAGLRTELAVPASQVETPAGFAAFIKREVGELDASLGAAEQALRDVAAGRPVELHDVMISLEQARLGVQTFIQVRNRLVESWQDLMRMQL